MLKVTKEHLVTLFSRTSWPAGLTYDKTSDEFVVTGGVGDSEKDNYLEKSIMAHVRSLLEEKGYFIHRISYLSEDKPFYIFSRCVVSCGISLGSGDDAACRSCRCGLHSSFYKGQKPKYVDKNFEFCFSQSFRFKSLEEAIMFGSTTLL